MKILHLYKDWKWTGPAEPVLLLCKEFKKYCHIFFICEKAPKGIYPNLPQRAKEWGVEAITNFFNKKSFFADVKNLLKFIKREGVEIVHVHQSYEHIISALARLVYKNFKIVRTNFKKDGLCENLMSRFLVNEFTNAYLTFSKRLYAREEKYCKGKIYLINPWMELEKYNPGAKFMDMKQRWRVVPDEFVFGVISRIKKGRGFDVLLEGFKIALAKNPKLRLIIVGRGTKAKELAILPAERLGIKDRIIFTGYLTENYLDTIACFDAFIYLSHGSDGSCRALREAMAMGKPAIGTRMGLIPELIEEGINGIIVKNTPEALADGMLRLSSNPDACRIMGEGARKKALSEFSLNQSAEDILKIYNQILQK